MMAAFDPSSWTVPRLRIDREGTWYHEDQEVTHGGIVASLREGLRVDAGGHYLQVGPTRVPVAVEDAPFVVVRVEREAGGVHREHAQCEEAQDDQDHPGDACEAEAGVAQPEDEERQQASHEEYSEDHAPDEEPTPRLLTHRGEHLGVDDGVVYAADSLKQAQACND